MFGIGPTELIVILVIALLVLGPKRLPELAAGLGKGLAEFRRATADINAELDEARRAVEEPARDAARSVQGDSRRVSRTTRPGSPMEKAAGEDDAAKDDDDVSSGEGEDAAADTTPGGPKATA